MKNPYDTFPTPEQESIIKSVIDKDGPIITIVDACPGSGKTRVFVEILQDCIKNWEFQHAGIAALSFTNAAQEEIKKRIGKNIPYPHFVGTFDSFIYHHIVKPFGDIAGITSKGAQLIPSPFDEIYDGLPVPYEMDQTKDNKEFQKKISIYKIKFIGEKNNKPVLVFKQWRNLKSIKAEYINKVLWYKKTDWGKTGHITHSDCNYIAKQILEDKNYGQTVIKIITQRFPYIFVDELQDTGYFLRRTLINLLKSSKKGFVVGDPDQSIYEFTGADPKIFDEIKSISGAKELPLSKTFRCRKKIADIASHLSCKKNKIIIPHNEDIKGKNILFIHNYSTNFQICDTLRAYIYTYKTICKDLAILTRNNAISKKFSDIQTDINFKGKSVVGKRLTEAINVFRNGDFYESCKIAEKTLGNILWEEERIHKIHNTLYDNNIDLNLWKTEIYKLLLELSEYKPDESWNQWLKDRALKYVKEGISNLELSCPERLGNKFRIDNKEGKILRKNIQIESELNDYLQGITISTIHKAKGKEFDGVLLFVAKPDKTDHLCISKTWWDLKSEERRVAFVAASRARKLFILCIHKDSYEALLKEQPEFINLFDETINLDKIANNQVPIADLKSELTPV